MDKDWNIYTTGLFRGTCDFNPDTGIYNLTATFSDNIFISKLDNFGKFIWAKSLCNGGQCWSKSIALDFNGNVYTTGYMEVTADFDSGPNVYNLNPIDY